MKQSMFIHENEADVFFRILSDPTKIPDNFHIVSKDTVQLVWNEQSSFQDL